ncbi:MAG: PQQ-dependent sugar dehydrogenase, partial [Actinomycetota bacterium]
ASLIFVFILTTSCGSTTTTSTTSTTSTTVALTASTSLALSGSVSYSSREIGKLAGAVDLIQRDIADSFFYVVSRNGIVQRWRPDGTILDTVLDISSATTSEGERGLLGLAFRKINKKWEAFIDYTDLSGDTIVSRFDVSSDGRFGLSPQPTGTEILKIVQPYSNHNGGAVVVGPDNMLYIGTGDGGSADDPERRALDKSQLLGKILRINPRNSGYDIPADNPFVDTPGARGEIWSLGLRNPWRFNFDVFGNIWIADVGQNKWEEVNVSPGTSKIPGGRGLSFGWSAYEGNHVFNKDVDSQGAIAPIYEYEHDGGACSISGGAIGTNTTTPGRAGWYFFGDYCTGTVTAILTDGTSTVASEPVLTDLGNITAVRSTFDGMFVISLEGTVRRIISTRQGSSGESP